MQRIPILRHQVMRFQQRRADPHARTLQPCRILAHPTPSYDSFPKYRKPARIRFAYTTDNPSMQTQWEYRTTLVDAAKTFSGKLKHDRIDAELQAAGRDGWELVSVFQGSNVKANLAGVLLVFKRPVSR
jgi:hypothetical protein